MILNDAAAILATPPGSLAYHLIITVTLALFYAVSQTHYRHTNLPRAGRWALAAGWVFALRLFFMVAASLNWLLLVSGTDVLPPLGRFVDLAALLLFAWAFLVPQSDLLSDRLLLFAVVLNVSALGLGLVGPRIGADAIGLTADRLDFGWYGLGMLTAIAIVLLLAIRRPPQWWMALAGFTGLAMGYAAQLNLTSAADPLGGFVRLANVVVYPILAISGSRAMILTQAEELEARSPSIDLSKLAFTQTVEQQIAVSLASLASAKTPEDLARRSVHAVSETMRAEYCLLISSPDSRGNFSIATGYDLIREQPIDGAPLDETRSPVLAAALEKNQVLTLSSRSKSPDVYALQTLLGLSSTGPGLLVPIANEKDSFGGLLLLSPFARRSWSEEQQQMVEAIGRHLADRFSQLRQTAPTSADAYEAVLVAQERVHQLERDNMRLFEALHSDEKLDAAGLEALPIKDFSQQEAEDTIAILEAEVERLKTMQNRPPELPTSEELEQMKDELQTALQDLMESRLQVEELETALAEDSGTGLRKRDLEAIGSIAQELRQPMSSVLGYTDLLLGESVGLLGAMQRKFLVRVKSAVERMGSLITDMIQVTAMEAGSFTLQPAPVDMLQCMEEAIEEISPAMREKKLALQMDFPDEVPAVLGDEEAVSQILLHLLKNAVDASPERTSITISAGVETVPDNNFLMLAVSDSGEGVPPEDLARVFQNIREPERNPIPGLGDSGVGLSLVKGLSEALGGRVWLESEVGAGSTFTVLLPLAEGSVTESAA